VRTLRRESGSHGVASTAISPGRDDQRFAGELAFGSGWNTRLLVFATATDRKLLHGGHVQSFMEGAGRSGAHRRWRWTLPCTEPSLESVRESIRRQRYHAAEVGEPWRGMPSAGRPRWDVSITPEHRTHDGTKVGDWCIEHAWGGGVLAEGRAAAWVSDQRP